MSTIENQIKEALKSEGIESDIKDEQIAPEVADIKKEANPDKQEIELDPLQEKINSQNKEIEQMKNAVDKFKELMDKQEKVAYNKALETLRMEKEEAILRGDVQAVMDIEKQQTNMNVAETPVAVTNFLQKYDKIFNSYGYEEMKIAEFAKRRDVDLLKLGLSPDEHVKVVEEHMKLEFPNYFGNQKEQVNRNSESIESGIGSNVARKSTNKSKITFHDLSDDEKKVARDLEKSGAMKIDDYLRLTNQYNDIK